MVSRTALPSADFGLTKNSVGFGRRRVPSSTRGPTHLKLTGFSLLEAGAVSTTLTGTVPVCEVQRMNLTSIEASLGRFLA